MGHRWRIAIHESAHCVAARLVGLPCAYASVGLIDGEADFPADCGIASVIALMAGSVGEELLLGGYSEGGRQDWATASALLGDLGCDDDAAALWWYYTAAMLRPHLDVVVRLARALMRAQILDAAEIDALLAE